MILVDPNIDGIVHVYLPPFQTKLGTITSVTIWPAKVEKRSLDSTDEGASNKSRIRAVIKLVSTGKYMIISSTSMYNRDIN